MRVENPFRFSLMQTDVQTQSGRYSEVAIIQLVTLPLSPEVNYIARKRQTNRDQLNTNSVDIHLEGTPLRRMSLDLESLNLPELKVLFCQTPLFIGMSTDTH